MNNVTKTCLHPLDVSTSSFPWRQSHKQSGWVKGKATCKDSGCTVSNCVTVLPPPDVPASDRRPANAKARFCSRDPCSSIHSDCPWPANREASTVSRCASGWPCPRQVVLPQHGRPNPDSPQCRTSAGLTTFSPLHNSWWAGHHEWKGLHSEGLPLFRELGGPYLGT